MNYMHKILCLLALLPATAASVQAQSAGCIEILDGSARVREIAVSHNDDKLFVSMDIDISQLDLRSNREIVFSPAIESADEQLALPAVTIAGRNRYYHHLRNEAADETMQLYRTGQTDIIRYRAVVPYSEWMSLSDLNAESRECGCCNVQLASDKMRLTSIEIARPAPPVFVPSLVYIRPEAREKIVVAEGSAFIDFPVNRTEIHESYRNNTAELNKILATIDAIRNDADTRILAVTIKGYASPEGPYERNVELSKGRTETLKEYVRRQYSFPDGLLATDYEPEDWQGPGTLRGTLRAAKPRRHTRNHTRHAGARRQGVEDKVDLSRRLPLPARKRIPGTPTLRLCRQVRSQSLHRRRPDQASALDLASEVEPRRDVYGRTAYGAGQRRV